LKTTAAAARAAALAPTKSEPAHSNSDSNGCDDSDNIDKNNGHHNLLCCLYMIMTGADEQPKTTWLPGWMSIHKLDNSDLQVTRLLIWADFTSFRLVSFNAIQTGVWSQL